MGVYQYKKRNKKAYLYKFTLNNRTYLKRGFKTKAEAIASEKTFKNDLLQITEPSKIISKLTLKEAFEEYSRYCFETMKITTATDIKRQINNYFVKCFDSKRFLYQLSSSDALKAYQYINKLPINSVTKNKKLKKIQRFFTFCHDKYGFHYSSIYVLPKFREYKITRTKAKKEIIEVSELISLLSKADEYYSLALITLFIYGYRLGELLALKVDSVDFKNKTIENYQSVSFKVGNGNFVLTTPKTKKSERVRSCSDNYLKIVSHHIKINNLSKNDFIFFSRANQNHGDIPHIPMHENTFRKGLKKLDENLSPHMLRRSIITHLSENNISLEEISSYIGHEDIETTERYYLKVSKEKKLKINQVIDKLIKESLLKKGKE